MNTQSTQISRTGNHPQVIRENRFRELLMENITYQWKTFAYYRVLCQRKGVSLADLQQAIRNEDYYLIPGVVSTAFKKSRGLIENLNQLSTPGQFQVSSSTSGDPSYIYTSFEEMEHISDNYKSTFGIEGVSRAVAFAPSLRIMQGMSKKTGIMGRKSVLRMHLALEAALNHYDCIDFTLDIRLVKTIFSMISKGSPTLSKKTKEALIDSIKKVETSGGKITVGGFTLLMAPYLDEFKAGEFNLGKNCFVVFSGGGYGGMKGAIVGKKIIKTDFIRKISSVFGIDPVFWSTNIKDIYAFTESPATHEGYWDDDVGDFVFNPWHQSRVYIVDPETEKPLQSGKGMLKIIAPSLSGRSSSCNVSLVQKDMAQILSVDKRFCIQKFSHITRSTGSGIEGCAYKADGMANQ